MDMDIEWTYNGHEHGHEHGRGLGGGLTWGRSWGRRRVDHSPNWSLHAPWEVECRRRGYEMEVACNRRVSSAWSSDGRSANPLNTTIVYQFIITKSYCISFSRYTASCTVIANCQNKKKYCTCALKKVSLGTSDDRPQVLCRLQSALEGHDRSPYFPFGRLSAVMLWPLQLQG